MKLFHDVAHGLSSGVCFVQQGRLQGAGRKGKRKQADSKVRNWISQKRQKLATKGTAPCQGPYQQFQVCALVLVWAAFLGACKDFSFKGNKTVVSNAVRWGFRFSALPQSRCEMAHLSLMTEEGSEMDGTARGVCPATVDQL